MVTLVTLARRYMTIGAEEAVRSPWAGAQSILEFRLSNLFGDLPKSCADELVSVLASSKHVRVERIVSTGHSSSAGFWYDQDEHEWVTVLQGSAQLEFADGEIQNLGVGDHVLIPAHRRHRVASTSESEPTVWLAVFFRPDDESQCDGAGCP